MLALLVGVHVKTLRAAARDGRLPVTYDTRTTFRHLRARATPAAARAFRRSYYRRMVRPDDRRTPLTWASVPSDYVARLPTPLNAALAALLTAEAAVVRRVDLSGHWGVCLGLR